MKYKLLAVSTGNGEINIGDYIQALASSQFLPSIDGFIQREKLNEYKNEEAKIIMNGWFMDHPENWPPSENIKPLFVAFHINSTVKEQLTSPSSIAYLKKFEPIGCRDENTVSLLKEKGVNAYFSGCMTLTLGKKYYTEEVENKYYFVDPFFVTNWSLPKICKNLFILLFNWRNIKKIAQKYYNQKTSLRKHLIITTFYNEYRKVFSKDILLNAEYINQQNLEIRKKYQSNEALLKYAEELVKKYAKAKLVITSRIHCALPCIGLETPVIYIDNKQQSEASSCRLKGLKELFNIIYWNKDHLEDDFPGEIGTQNLPRNKDEHREIIEHLISKCSDFTK